MSYDMIHKYLSCTQKLTSSQFSLRLIINDDFLYEYEDHLEMMTCSIFGFFFHSMCAEYF